MDIYEPAEDSYLLQRFVRTEAFGRVLDVGTGSGIQALTAIKNANVREVIAVDINKKAVKELQQQIKEKKLRKIKVLHGDLFEKIDGKFDLIIFNPPYLPQDEGVQDAALYGGKEGWEVSARFLAEASKYLMPDGKILFLFSTLTKKKKIEELIQNHLLVFEELGKQKISFETLYVYQITKSALLRELESKLLENIHYFARGKRGIIYKATSDRSKLVKTHLTTKKDPRTVAIKVKREDSKAQGRIENEVKWLKVLNKKGVGPYFIFSRKNYLVYQFVEGDFILDWVQRQTNKKEIQTVLTDLLQQCLIMDKFHVNKEEMHHPLKHIVITTENKPVLLDFERCNETEKPQNVTQFIEFICRMKKELAEKGITIDVKKMRNLAAEYKDTYSKESFASILDALL